MSKTLLMVRHAKSSWDNSELSDHERPLLKLGIKRTMLIIDYLSKSHVKPDLIVSSHAVRAFETARMIAKGLSYPRHEIQIERNIYFHDADGLYNLAMALPDDKNVVMLVGHNPAMTQLANMFLDEKLDYLPTTGVVSMGFDTDQWNQIALANKELHFCVFPKMLKK